MRAETLNQPCLTEISPAALPPEFFRRIPLELLIKDGVVVKTVYLNHTVGKLEVDTPQEKSVALWTTKEEAEALLSSTQDGKKNELAEELLRELNLATDQDKTKSTSPFTAWKEIQLIRAWKIGGDELSMTNFVEANIGLIIIIANRHRDSGVPFDSLMQGGKKGLVEAVKRFDLNRGFKFSTFAHDLIRKGIQETIRNEGPLHISSNNRVTSISLQTPVGERGEDELGDCIIDKSPTIEERALKADTSDTLQEEMEKILTAREEQVVRLYYGLTVEKESFGIPKIRRKLRRKRSTIMGIKKGALEKLRNDPKIQSLWDSSYIK